METSRKAKQDWLKTFLDLENGVPSHDTFARVFARIKPSEFQERFVRWVQAVRTKTDGEVVGIDGKTARRSHNKKVLCVSVRKLQSLSDQARRVETSWPDF